MSEINKINLKALKENYMKKPEEEKIIKTTEVNLWENNINSDKNTVEKTTNIQKRKENNNSNTKVWEKELFSKYESYFKKEENKIQDKLHIKAKGKSKSKKYLINFFAWITILQLIIIPGYFIYSWGNLDFLKASVNDNWKNTAPKNIEIKNTNNTGSIKINEIIIKKDEKFNIWWYIFDIKTETNSSWIKKYFYKSKEYENKEKLRKWLEKEIERLKRKKLIKLLLEEKKMEKELEEVKK